MAYGMGCNKQAGKTAALWRAMIQISAPTSGAGEHMETEDILRTPTRPGKQGPLIREVLIPERLVSMRTATFSMVGHRADDGLSKEK